MKFIAGISDIIDRYDAVITDIWGVLHDGTVPHEGVVECLCRLMDSGKKVLLLSNSGRRVRVVSRDLCSFGILPELYTFLVTSGELTHLSFKRNRDERLLKLGERYFLFGSEKYGLTDGLGLRRTHEAATAEFILTIGVKGNPTTTASYEQSLGYFARRGLTMVCANPDLWVNRNGVLGIGPGALAAYYEKLGGRVIYFGKPYKEIYDFCLTKLSGVERSRMLVVGDGLKTDIEGANRCGLASLLVGTGVHWQELSTMPTDIHDLTKLCRAENTFPTMIAKGLIW